MDVTLRLLKNNNDEFKQLHKWCKNKFVYEWFEQRILSYDEIVNKYKTKLKEKIQDLYIIECDNSYLSKICKNMKVLI